MMAGVFKARSGSLTAALDIVALRVGGRQKRAVPALGAVRFAADGGRLSITTTTVDGTVTIHLHAAAEGELAVPLGPLAELARHFPVDAEITISADDRAATVSAGSSSFGLPIFPFADLREPLILGIETGHVELDAKTARDLFVRPSFAAADDISRPYLNGILLHSTGERLFGIATDGVRFCRIAVSAPTTLSSDHCLIIPKEMVKCLDRLLGSAAGSVTLRRSERLFQLDNSEFVAVSRRVEATYPAYERWTPSAGPNVVTLGRAEFRHSLARFAAVADPQIPPHIVRLRWDTGGLHLRADGGEDHLKGEVEGEAETAVQIRFIAEMADALRGDRIRISAPEPGRMILVTDPEDDNFLSGLMPIRPRSS